MKKALCALLAFAMLLSLTPAALAEAQSFDNFRHTATYTGAFADVPEDAWYYGSVVFCFETGLIRGATDTAFCPDEPLTVAQAVALAARIRSTYMDDGANLTERTPWYQVYVDYARSNSILTIDIPDFNAPADRQTFAHLMARCLPEAGYAGINTVEKNAIPDVPSTHPFYTEIDRLYRAGIMTGSDELGTFHPDSTLTRAEAAATVARLADPAQRKSVTLIDIESHYYNVPFGGITFRVRDVYGLEDAGTDTRQFAAYEGEGTDPVSVLELDVMTGVGSTETYFDLMKLILCTTALSMLAEQLGFTPAGEPEFRDVTVAGFSGEAGTCRYTVDVDGTPVPAEINSAYVYDPAVDTVHDIILITVYTSEYQIDYSAEFWRMIDTAKLS